MKRFVPVVLALFLGALFVPYASAATAAAKSEAKGKTPGLELATLASETWSIRRACVTFQATINLNSMSARYGHEDSTPIRHRPGDDPPR